MKLPFRRGLVQTLAALAQNAYLPGFLTGRIYTGQSKHVCVPGLNCYSCPGALGACPLGSLQNALASYDRKLPLYVGGLLLLFGVTMGRWICGWICPFGWIQELLAKLKKRQIKVPASLRPLRWVKYGLLAVLVIALPLLLTNEFGIGSPWFCKAVCPAGTLTAALPLLAVDGTLRSQLGDFFVLKATIATVVVVGSVFIFRFFCRYMCPLGAIYGLFNRIALYRFAFHGDKCTHCGACSAVCPMGIDPVKDPNSPECIRCGACVSRCPHEALQARFGLRN